MTGLTAQFFQSYFVGFMILFTLTAGGLAILLLHLLVGGQWGLASRKPVRAITAMFPWVTLLFIPVLLGAHSIYSWTNPDVAADLGRKGVWLKLPFFALRSCLRTLPPSPRRRPSRQPPSLAASPTRPEPFSLAWG